MDPVALRELYDHHAWTMDRLLALAREVPPERAAEPWGAAGSLTAILDHILSAQRIWLGRWREEGPVAWTDAGTVAEVGRRWPVVQAEMRGFLATLGPEAPARAFPQYPAPRDRRTLGAAITHVLVHSAQHAAEAAELLTQLGHSPGDLDFMEFLDEREQAHPLHPL